MNGKAMVCAMAGILFSTAGCSAEAPADALPVTAESSKILVAYYSWGGNTRRVAEEIQKETGGTLFEIKPVKAYPSEYGTCVEQAKKDIRANARPELASKIDGFAKYDVIFVGSPNWWGTMAPPVATFLTSYDFKGKTVIFFFTNGGGGMQNCERDARKLCPGARMPAAKTFPGNSTTGLTEWLKQVIKIGKTNSAAAAPVPAPAPAPARALSLKERGIITSAAFAAKGDAAGLKKSLASGLDAGVTVSEYKEILVQVYAYCGFPRSLNALNTLKTLLEERGSKDAEGKLPGPLPSGKSIDFGTVNQTKLCGAPVKGALFDFAPAIDEYLKAHLFGDIFGRDNVDWKTRELATVAMLAAMENVDPQLKAHIAIAKRNGVSEEQLAEIFAIVRDETNGGENTSPFPFGQENTAYARYFSGRSWLAPVTADKRLNVPVFNVTFEPGCRNNWHKHSGGQILIASGGIGFYQERGKAARKLMPGDAVEIPPDVEHWHGAAPECWFAHLALECNPADNKNTWLEPVSDADYHAAVDGK